MTTETPRLKTVAEMETNKPLTEGRVAREAARILRRLVESGAVLAVARDMEMAVVVRDGPDGQTVRAGVVDREIAEVMALREWIASADPAARVARYHVTQAGRNALYELLAASENRARCKAETPDEAAANKRVEADDDDDTPVARFVAADSPLIGLARRREKDGQPFLSRAQVAAGERLREDFELAHLGPQITQNWDTFLTGGVSTSHGGGAAGQGALAAQTRVIEALKDLGPGLGDIALRCCCFLEGLETAEQKMGWAARSGKIVLRIALTRLARYYEQAHGKFGPLIG